MLGLFSSRKPGLREIVVPDAAKAAGAEPDALMKAVVDFVDAMLNRACYRRWELPDEAMQAYHAGRYHAQVSEGGHALFVRSSGLDPLVLADIERALTAMQAGSFLDCFTAMKKWAAANPAAAAAGNGAPAREPELDALDKRFFEADRAATTGFHVLGRQWLQGLRALKPVPAANLDLVLDKLISDNPHRAQRADDALVERLDADLASRLLAGLHIAGRRCDPAHRIRGLAGSRVEIIDGEQMTVWSVSTDQGPRFAVEFPDMTVLLEEIEVERATETGTRKVRRKEPIAVAKPESVDAAIAHAGEHDVAVAAVTMLRKLGIAGGPQTLAYFDKLRNARLGSNSASYLMTVKPGTDLFVMIGADGAALVDLATEETVGVLDARGLAKAVAAHAKRRDADLAKLDELRAAI